MIDPEQAEASLEYLRKTAADIGKLTTQAREKAAMVKHVEGLLVKAQHNGKIPVTVARDYARSSERYLEAITEDAIAAGELAKLEAERDAAKIRIMLYQTQVKDRM